MTEERAVHFARRGVGQPVSLLALVALLLSGALTLSAPSTASAQTGSPDAEWAFAAMGIFADPRVQLGLALQVDSEDAGEAGDVTLAFLDQADIDASAEDAGALLAAAGIVPAAGASASASSFIVERPCRVWGETAGMELAATALGEQFSDVWAQYGVTFPPCDVTQDPTIADILVFSAGTTPAEVDLSAPRDEGSFLGVGPAAPATATPSAGTGSPAGPTDSSGATTGNTGSDVTPAEGGSMGDGATDGTVGLIVGLLAAAVALGGGRAVATVRPIPYLYYDPTRRAPGRGARRERRPPRGGRAA